MKNKILALAVFSLSIISCGGGGAGEEKAPAKPVEQLNVTVLLDLSSRISSAVDKNKGLQPTPVERDRQIVVSIAEMVKQAIRKKGAFQSKDKLRVIFSPAPADPEINQLAAKLSVDFSADESKTEKFNTFVSEFDETLKAIYSKATSNKVSDKDYPGSDIWRFFRSDVKELGIESDPAYRNILVILTDGYLLHEQSLKERQGNRSGFISEGLLTKEGLRAPNWQSKFDSGDYGLISFGQDYSNLEVFVFEINPASNHPNDEYVIKAYLQKWFKEMKVKGADEERIFKTDLPENTKRRIEKFFTLTAK